MKKVLSFALWNSIKKNTVGALRNAELVLTKYVKINYYRLNRIDVDLESRLTVFLIEQYKDL